MPEHNTSVSQAYLDSSLAAELIVSRNGRVPHIQNVLYLIERGADIFAETAIPGFPCVADSLATRLSESELLCVLQTALRYAQSPATFFSRKEGFTLLTNVAHMPMTLTTLTIMRLLLMNGCPLSQEEGEYSAKRITSLLFDRSDIWAFDPNSRLSFAVTTAVHMIDLAADGKNIEGISFAEAVLGEKLTGLYFIDHLGTPPIVTAPLLLPSRLPMRSVLKFESSSIVLEPPETFCSDSAFQPESGLALIPLNGLLDKTIGLSLVDIKYDVQWESSWHDGRDRSQVALVFDDGSGLGIFFRRENSSPTPIDSCAIHRIDDVGTIKC